MPSILPPLARRLESLHEPATWCELMRDLGWGLGSSPRGPNLSCQVGPPGPAGSGWQLYPVVDVAMARWCRWLVPFPVQALDPTPTPPHYSQEVIRTANPSLCLDLAVSPSWPGAAAFFPGTNKDREGATWEHLFSNKPCSARVLIIT